MMHDDDDNGMTTISVKDELDDVEILSEPYIPQHDLFGPRRRVLFGIVLVIVIIIVIISVSTSKNNNNSSSSSVPASPNATVDTEDQALFNMIKSALNGVDVPHDDLLLKDSYQHKAFTWLTENGNLTSYDRTRKLQRYALAAFFYATNDVGHKYDENPSPWDNETLWLSDELECEWHGISCNEKNLVIGISLKNNSLSGKIPRDLAVIRDPLRTIDVASNSIYMEGDDFELFVHAHRLHTLIIEDNYLTSTTGLPIQLKALTSLQKLQASQTLMGGPLDNGVLESFVNLTYVDLDFNFFTGAPHFLGNMTKLEFVYLRSNNLNGHLNFIKTGKLVNLDEIWLDHNKIGGSIPTQVGHLVSLTDFSVTNTSLTGKIPTEFGALPNLSRLYLHDNKLTGTIPTQLGKLTQLNVLNVCDNNLNGTMPLGVCRAINASTYKKKELVADCDKVECNCCTDCK